MGRVTAARRVTRIDAGRSVTRPDTVVVEEPLEMRVNSTPLAVTMRTPGADIELAQGFPLTEGVITDRGEIAAIRYCNSVDVTGRNTYNILDIAPPVLRCRKPDSNATFTPRPPAASAEKRHTTPSGNSPGTPLPRTSSSSTPTPTP